MKKKSIILGFILASALTVGAVSAFASDPLSSQVTSIQKMTEANSKIEQKTLLQVGTEKITNTDLENYKAYKTVETTPLDDAQLLEELATEKLFLQLAEAQGVAATLDDGKKEAEKNREILSQQPQKIQDTQNKLIEAMGMSEDQYWNEYAPAEYQKILSVQNLTEKLIKDKKINADSSNLATELKNFRHQLFESSLKDNKIKVLDNTVNFK